MNRQEPQRGGQVRPLPVPSRPLPLDAHRALQLALELVEDTPRNLRQAQADPRLVDVLHLTT